VDVGDILLIEIVAVGDKFPLWSVEFGLTLERVAPGEMSPDFLDVLLGGILYRSLISSSSRLLERRCDSSEMGRVVWNF
jgi:hypothetical protein